MTRHRSHSAAFKRQVAEEFDAGETLHALSKRHDVSRQPVRISVRAPSSDPVGRRLRRVARQGRLPRERAGHGGPERVSQSREEPPLVSRRATPRDPSPNHGQCCPTTRKSGVCRGRRDLERRRQRKLLAWNRLSKRTPCHEPIHDNAALHRMQRGAPFRAGTDRGAFYPIRSPCPPFHHPYHRPCRRPEASRSASPASRPPSLRS
jgi:transposase-like protein